MAPRHSSPSSATPILAYDTELADLLELARRQQLDYVQLIYSIKQSIAEAYAHQYPKAAPVEILLDESSGHIRLLSNNKDVTPPEFQTTANSQARQVIIQQLKSVPDPTLSSTTANVQSPPKYKFVKWLCNFIFWGYNTLILFVEATILITLIDTTARKNLWQTILEQSYFYTAGLVILLLTPALTVYMALKTKAYRSTGQLLTLFFVFEIPIILLAFFILNNFADPIPPVAFILSLFLFAVPVLLITYRGLIPTQKSWQIAHLVFLLCLLLTLAYLGLLLAFALPPVIGSFWKEFFSRVAGPIYHVRAPDITEIIWNTLGSGILSIFFLIILIFLALPYFILVRVYQQTQAAYNRLAQTTSSKFADRMLAISAIGFMIFSAILSYQPNLNPYIEQLTTFSKSQTYEQKAQLAQQLLPQQANLKEAIKDYHQLRSKYLLTVDSQGLGRAYKDIFNLSESSAQSLQKIYLQIARPFVLQTNISNLSQITEAYDYLFPNYIQSDNTHNVILKSRTININSDQTLATVTVTEQYENTTEREQEIIYEFSLPAAAAITGLKLGPNLEYTGLIAPKGAATQVYERELNRNRDPALLEQVGPRQYRLRVFPVPGKSDRTILNGQLQKVQFTYVTLREPSGYALPQYTRTVNLDTQTAIPTTFLLNNKSYKLDNSLFATAFDASANCTPPAAISNIVINSNGNSYQIAPVSAGWDSTCRSALQPTLFNQITNRRLALYLDTSHGDSAQQLIQEITFFFNNYPELLTRNRIDVYLFNDTLSQPFQLSSASLSQLKDLPTFGKNAMAYALQFAPTNYDNIFILTQTTQSWNATTTVPFTSPVYFIHPTGHIDTYPAKITAQIIKQDGYVTDSLTEAFLQLASRYNITSASNRTVFYSPYWQINLGSTLGNHPSINNLTGYQSLAAKAMILNLLASSPFDTTLNAPILNDIHQLAESNHTISPISSLIALVNQQQINLLQQFSQSATRFTEQFNPQTGQVSTRFSTPPPNIGFFGARTGIENNALAPMAYDGGSTTSMVSSPFNGLSLIIILHVLLLGAGLLGWFGHQAIRRFWKKSA